MPLVFRRAARRTGRPCSCFQAAHGAVPSCFSEARSSPFPHSAIEASRPCLAASSVRLKGCAQTRAARARHPPSVNQGLVLLGLPLFGLGFGGTPRFVGRAGRSRAGKSTGFGAGERSLAGLLFGRAAICSLMLPCRRRMTTLGWLSGSRISSTELQLHLCSCLAPDRQETAHQLAARRRSSSVRRSAHLEQLRGT